MDKVYLNGMEFYGYHGVLPEEKKLGQIFIVDAVLEVDLNQAGLTDDLTKTVNYAEVYECIKRIAEGQPCKLIETVAEKVVCVLLTEFGMVKSCTIKVTKPNPPFAGHYQSVAVEITRGRE